MEIRTVGQKRAFKLCVNCGHWTFRSNRKGAVRFHSITLNNFRGKRCACGCVFPSIGGVGRPLVKKVNKP